jgi:hypothetical protein
MADLKISQLTDATTPLAGTEVLPIVQAGVTKKIPTDNLTVKNLRSNATDGVLQVTGPAAASTRVMTVPDANFTAARTDAAQSFTGDQTLATGNLVIGTAGKGIDFSADPSAAGMTSELLNDYEEGTWTPTDGSGAGLTLTNLGSTYTKIGRKVTCFSWITFPSTASGSGFTIGGLPFAASGTTNGLGVSGFNSGNFQLFIRTNSSTTIVAVKDDNSTITNAMMSGATFGFTYTYFV